MGPPDRDGHVRVRSKCLNYRRVGEAVQGTAIVIRGGPGSTHEYLAPLTDLAGAGYEVVFYDQLYALEPIAADECVRHVTLTSIRREPRSIWRSFLKL